MRFKVLGPLEVVENTVTIPLGGMNQRAVLGYLLLYSNKVVATSQLLRALWGEQAPPTARKMLQNAISGLRRALDSSLLVTHAPGYLLRVDPDTVDLCRFEGLARKGRAAVGVGDWNEADRYLSEALALWRGPVLGDLAENGYDWPELSAVRNARFAVLEDRTEAVLSAGRHLEVIGELEALVRAEPLRERLCAQLMSALYRAGRQADALAVYQRTRASLVEKLGLDPSRELRELERAILDHDPALMLTGGRAEHGLDGVVVQHKSRAEPIGAYTEPTVRRPRQSVPDSLASERKSVTAVLVRAATTDAAGGSDPEMLDRLLAELGETFEHEVHQHGGLNHGTLGPVRLALFGTEQTREDDVQRAVRAAMAICERVGGAPHVAVAGGEALVVRAGGTEDVSVTGRFLDEGMRLLFDVPPGVVRVCENTREACAREFALSPAGSVGGGYDIIGRCTPELGGRISVPLVQRERELQLLDQLLEDVRQRSRTHLVTVLGEAGVGKSRLMHEFRRAVTESGEVRCLVGCNRLLGPDLPFASLTGIVRGYAGMRDDDPIPARERKLHAAVTELVGTGPICTQMIQGLRDLLALSPGGPEPVDPRPVLATWRRFVEEIAARGPLVIILEDMGRVDDMMLKFVGDLAELVGTLPLLVVVTARPELTKRATYWAGGRRNATTMTLEPLSRPATRTLLDDLLTRPEPGVSTCWSMAPPTGEKLTSLCTSLVDQVGGNPLFAMEYVRLVRDRGARGGAVEAGKLLPVPQLVHNIISTRIDTLTAAEKSVLYDAALFTAQFCPRLLAEIGDRDITDVEEYLEALERHDLLRRCALGPDLGHFEYVFNHAVVREVAYSRLPHAVRADKHSRAAEWIRAQPRDQADLLVHHYRQSVHHATLAGGSPQDLMDKACDGLIQAGHQALSRGGRRAALHCYRSALEFCPPRHPQRALLLRWCKQGLDAESAS